MKRLLKSITPKQIFRFKKSPSSVLKSEPSSFGSASYSSSSSSSEDSSSASHRRLKPVSNPPARTRSEEILNRSDDWSDSVDVSRFDFVQAFKIIDRDGDGKITRFELESLLKRVGGNPLEEEVVEMVREIDRDGDGCISLDDLKAVGSLFESTAPGEEELRDAFDFFDADHDGKITAEELHAVFTALGDEQCTLADCWRMIEGVDKNGDGFVCFEDFARMMNPQR